MDYRYYLFDILKRRIGRKNVLFTKLMLSPKNIYDWLDKLYLDCHHTYYDIYLLKELQKVFLDIFLNILYFLELKNTF
jgi:hypothetical protein